MLGQGSLRWLVGWGWLGGLCASVAMAPANDPSRFPLDDAAQGDWRCDRLKNELPVAGKGEAPVRLEWSHEAKLGMRFALGVLLGATEKTTV